MKKTLAAATALTLASLCAAPLAEDAKDPNATPKADTAAASETAVAMSKLALARQLASFGMAEQDPLALIVAARIMQAQPPGESKAQKQDGERATEADPLMSVDHLLAQAKELSGGRAEVIALADDVADSSRGAVGGANVVTDRVRGNTTDVWTIEFRGERGAEVGVIADGPGDTIDCLVLDENGNDIDSDTDYTSTCAMSWTPSWTGEFKVKIRNLTSSSVPYVLITN